MLTHKQNTVLFVRLCQVELLRSGNYLVQGILMCGDDLCDDMCVARNVQRYDNPLRRNDDVYDEVPQTIKRLLGSIPH